MNDMRNNAVNVLETAGVISRWELRRRLETLTDKDLRRYRNCGERTLEACHEVIDELCAN